MSFWFLQESDDLFQSLQHFSEHEGLILVCGEEGVSGGPALTFNQRCHCPDHFLVLLSHVAGQSFLGPLVEIIFAFSDRSHHPLLPPVLAATLKLLLDAEKLLRRVRNETVKICLSCKS